MYLPMSFDYGVISGKTVVVAASVFSLLQVVKKCTNWSFLKGKWAIAANIVFNVVGVIALTPAPQLATLGTGIKLLTGILVASGFHGIATTLVPAIGSAGDPAVTDDESHVTVLHLSGTDGIVTTVIPATSGAGDPDNPNKVVPEPPPVTGGNPSS